MLLGDGASRREGVGARALEVGENYVDSDERGRLLSVLFDVSF